MKTANHRINCLLYFIITPQRVNLSCATTTEPTEHLGPITLAGKAVVILLRSFFQLQPYSQQVVTEDEFSYFHMAQIFMPDARTDTTLPGNLCFLPSFKLEVLHMLGKCVTNFTLMQLEQLRNVQKVGHFLCWPAFWADYIPLGSIYHFCTELCINLTSKKHNRNDSQESGLKLMTQFTSLGWMQRIQSRINELQKCSKFLSRSFAYFREFFPLFIFVFC